MSNVNDATSLRVPSLDGTKIPNPANPAETLRKLNDKVNQLTCLVGNQRDGQEEKRTLLERVHNLETQCSELKELMHHMVLSRNQLSVIRETVEQLTIYFSSNSITPCKPAEFETDVEKIVAALKLNQDFILRIQGHSNSHFIGGEMRGIERSKNRAEFVRNEVIKRFLSQPAAQQQIQGRLEIQSLGNTRPVVSGKSMLNCRVTFLVVEKLASLNPELAPLDQANSDDGISIISGSGGGDVSRNASGRLN